jgi:CheY-like chemotaxis protein
VKVLAIDDEPDARKLIKRLLELAGARVRVVGAVGEALEALETFAPDVVVSDISLPGIDGYEFIRCVRALGPHHGQVPAVALTAYARAEDRQKALSAGFNEHLPKPVDPGTLVAVLARVVREGSRQ